MRFLLVASFWLICSSLFAQSSSVQNIVPNPGFERYSSTPIGWFYKGDHFTKVMKYWDSPTSASPDIFGNKVRVPASWSAKGFGHQGAHSGQSMVGITAYGCEDGKPHCREYLQIQLNEPLVPGQTYHAEFWVSHLPRSLQINNLGMYFSETPIEVQMPEQLDFEPQLKAEHILIAPGNSWTKVSGEIKAEKAANYLIIGNFSTDQETQTKPGSFDPLKFAYYYVDDVNVHKTEPILQVPLEANDLSQISLEVGKIIPLKDIYFDTDQAVLLPRSFIELDKLLELLLENRTMKIEIHGHTDNQGSSDYNIGLSERRAAAVVYWLQQKGIDSGRVVSKGFGDTQSIASNENSSGRQMNRRVEFLILNK